MRTASDLAFNFEPLPEGDGKDNLRLGGKIMNEATKRMAAGIFEAIQAEGDGYHFYKMAAMSTTDEQGKEVFEALANEELSHLEYLKEQYKSLVEKGKADPKLTLGTRRDLSGLSPIFSNDIRRRVGQAHFEMTALSIGIQLEQSSKRFYLEQSNQATDDTVKSFFKELAEWEDGHYKALVTQRNELKDYYWAENRFAPF